LVDKTLTTEGPIKNEEITIPLRNINIDDLTYLSVVTARGSVLLGHALLNAAGLLFKAEQVLAVLTMGFFTAYFLH
jgi:hypothetical protein